MMHRRTVLELTLDSLALMTLGPSTLISTYRCSPASDALSIPTLMRRNVRSGDDGTMDGVGDGVGVGIGVGASVGVGLGEGLGLGAMLGLGLDVSSTVGEGDGSSVASGDAVVVGGVAVGKLIDGDGDRTAMVDGEGEASAGRLAVGDGPLDGRLSRMKTVAPSNTTSRTASAAVST
jgi:hypothetical protein